MFCRRIGTCCWSLMEVRKKGYIKEGGREGGGLKVKEYAFHINMFSR